MSEWIINCPKCSCEMRYRSLDGYNYAKKHNVSCVSCRRSPKEKIRSCPLCGDAMVYRSETGLAYANRKNLICVKCRERIRDEKKKVVHKRSCPVCGKEITYAAKFYRDDAERAGRKCHSCSAKESSNREDVKKRLSECAKLNIGSRNPFWGKTHSKETIEKIKNRDKSFFKTKEYKEKRSKRYSGSGNNMFGKSLYDVWLSKYGKEEADRRLAEFGEKSRRRNRGSGNPMFGKRGVPKKPYSRDGAYSWSGWYKEYHFRSLLELSFFILVLEPHDCTWKSAERKKYWVRYIDKEGVECWHYADFVVNDEYIVEIKPWKLLHDIDNILKRLAMEEFCWENGFKYRVFDVKTISFEKFKELCENGSVSLDKNGMRKLEKLKAGCTKRQIRCFDREVQYA